MIHSTIYGTVHKLIDVARLTFTRIKMALLGTAAKGMNSEFVLSLLATQKSILEGS